MFQEKYSLHIMLFSSFRDFSFRLGFNKIVFNTASHMYVMYLEYYVIIQ